MHELSTGKVIMSILGNEYSDIVWRLSMQKQQAFVAKKTARQGGGADAPSAP